MGLLDIISPLQRPLVGDDSSSSPKEGRDDVATVTVEHDIRAGREEANIEIEVVVKRPVKEIESTDETVSEEVDAESHMDDEDARDDTEVAANATEEAEPEDGVVEPEPESESEVEVEVEVNGEPEAEGEPELEDEDEESDDAEVEDEKSDDETVDNADTPTVDRICGIGLAHAKCLSGTGIKTIADLMAVDADRVGDEIDVSPKCVQRWTDCAGDA